MTDSPARDVRATAPGAKTRRVRCALTPGAASLRQASRTAPVATLLLSIAVAPCAIIGHGDLSRWRQ
jgi:hypothetical protein